MAEATGLLVKVRGDGAGFAAATRSLRLGAADVEPILTVPPAAGPGLGAGADRGATWLKLGAKAARSENPWDNAHDLIGRGGAFAAAGGPEVLAVEPDIRAELGLQGRQRRQSEPWPRAPLRSAPSTTRNRPAAPR